MTTLLYILSVLSVCMACGLLAALLALGLMEGDDPDERLH
jgi:hypothetical protein